MSLAAGQRLSYYEILAPLGAGGMGEVWRARDERLEREVAIKVLPEELATDEQRLLRFEREAKTLASLNHPNVAGIYDVGRAEDSTFLALELVPGKDLETRLESGRLSIEETIEICRQTAEGLEAAHDAGVVHRDLKPANIRLTPDGVVKILDFGLAKRTGTETRPGSKTISVEGAAIGTPAYMSPEQARGLPVDRRADIWAFGCVLFECLAGHRAFSGDSVADVLSAVIDHDWDRASLPRDVPAPLRQLLARCLDKDPRRRLRDIGEARVLLSEPIEEDPPRPASRSLVRSMPLVVIALIAAVFAGRMSVPLDEVDPIRQHRLSEMEGIEEMPAIAPGGELVAFVASVDGHSQIFVRQLSGGIPRQITDLQAHHTFPRWIDDGTLLFLRSKRAGEPGTLFQILVNSASAPRPITAADGEVDVSPDGDKLATFRRDGKGPYLVIIERHDPKSEKITRLDEGAYTAPRFSPDGKSLAFEVKPYQISAKIQVMDLASGDTESIATKNQTRGLAWLPDGESIVYASSKGSTLPYPPVFTLRTVRIDGTEDTALPFGGAGYASYEQPDLSDDGELVACRLQLRSDIYKYPVGGTAEQNTAAGENITRQTGIVQVPSVSPTGDEVVYLSDSGGHANLWVTSLDNSKPTRFITNERDPDTVIAIPVWSPTDNRIAYVQAKAGGDPEIWLVDSDGLERKPLVRGAAGPSWSANGEWVYYVVIVGAALPAPETWRISTKTGEKEHVRSGAVGLTVTKDGKSCIFTPSAHDASEIRQASPVDSETYDTLRSDLGPRIPMLPHQYVISPDGKWIAGPLKDGNTTNLYRISMTDGREVQVTDFGSRRTMIARQVSWSPGGTHLFAAVMEMDADIVLLEGAVRGTR